MGRSNCCSMDSWTSVKYTSGIWPPVGLTTMSRPAKCPSPCAQPLRRHYPLSQQRAIRGDSMASAALPTGYSATQTINSYITTSIEHGILGATTRASLKLGIICAIVGWLFKMKRLPSDTSNVLSKVAFNLCIPAALFINVAQILTAQKDMVLFWIPVAAIFQV